MADQKNANMSSEHEQQSLLLQCQSCGGISSISGDQLFPGAEIGCGFCASHSVAFYDPSQYAPPTDLLANLNLNPSNDPLAAAPNSSHNTDNSDTPVRFQDAQEYAEPTNESEIGEIAPRRRRLPQPGMQEEMNRRSWVVGSLRQQHEEMLRMLGDPYMSYENEEINPYESEQIQLPESTQEHENENIDGVQEYMMNTMMALRNIHGQLNDDEERFADAEDNGEDYLSQQHYMSFEQIQMNGHENESSYEDRVMDAEVHPGGTATPAEDEQLYATPEQAEQMRLRRIELQTNVSEREREKLWRMTKFGSLGAIG